MTVPIVALGQTTGGTVNFDLNNFGDPTTAPLATTTLTTKGTNNLTVIGDDDRRGLSSHFVHRSDWRRWICGT